MKISCWVPRTCLPRFFNNYKRLSYCCGGWTQGARHDATFHTTFSESKWSHVQQCRIGKCRMCSVLLQASSSQPWLHGLLIKVFSRLTDRYESYLHSHIHTALPYSTLSIAHHSYSAVIAIRGKDTLAHRVEDPGIESSVLCSLDDPSTSGGRRSQTTFGQRSGWRQFPWKYFEWP